MNLADLCRYSSLGGEETATIEDECMIQKQYLDLEKLKYDDRIEYEIYVDRDCRYREIPRLLLQPILENSIVHGIGNGSITITIRVSSEEVTGRGVMTKISISDNGVGFDADTLVEEENSGIAGVKSRARQFDSEMLFSCSSKPGEGTQTVLMFRENQMT